jgi:hypothetical protein
LVDASCAPADIRYPTDISLLNEAREKTEAIIDILHDPLKGKEPKVRTYRQTARREYLKVAKKRKVSRNQLRKALRKQLSYLRRNLQHIENLSGKTSLEVLSKKQYRDLLVISELYRQQLMMYERETHRAEGRIVSISQPHVRPIVRGKAGTPVEFGAKFSVSVVDGYVFLERVSWDNYHEANDLIDTIERYKQRFGYYPVSVHVDKTYRNRENLKFCKSHGIRLSGPPLGRPPKELKNQKLLKRQSREDELARIPVEGKLGNGKRRYKLDCIMEKRDDTSVTTIGMIVLVMNLEKIIRDLLFVFFVWRDSISTIVPSRFSFDETGPKPTEMAA